MEESNKHSVSLDDDVQDESLTVPGTLLVSILNSINIHKILGKTIALS